MYIIRNLNDILGCTFHKIFTNVSEWKTNNNSKVFREQKYKILISNESDFEKEMKVYLERPVSNWLPIQGLTGTLMSS